MANLCIFNCIFLHFSIAKNTYIDERNNKIQKVNEAKDSKELLQILKQLFNHQIQELNEIQSKYVWLRKEKRNYRNLNQIFKDINLADKEKVDKEIIKESTSLEIRADEHPLLIRKSTSHSGTISIV